MSIHTPHGPEELPEDSLGSKAAPKKIIETQERGEAIAGYGLALASGELK